MPKKPGLTFEQHQQIGQELSTMRNRLNSIWVQIANAYGNTGQNRAATDHLNKAIKDLDEARSKLDNLVYEERASEYPENVLNRVYYPGE